MYVAIAITKQLLYADLIISFAFLLFSYEICSIKKILEYFLSFIK